MIATNVDFQAALSALKAGYAIRRSGWNGGNQFVVVDKFDHRTHVEGPTTAHPVQPYLSMKNQQDDWQPGWLVSQGDLFAMDWEVIENPMEVS